MHLVCGTLYFHTWIIVTNISSTFELYIAQNPMNSLFWIIQLWGIDWSGHFKDSKPSYMLKATHSFSRTSSWSTSRVLTAITRISVSLALIRRAPLPSALDKYLVMMIIQPRKWEKTGTSDRSAAGNGCFSWRKNCKPHSMHWHEMKSWEKRRQFSFSTFCCVPLGKGMKEV